MPETVDWPALAARYSASERTLKRWAQIGRKQADPCPLGDAAAMVEWWGRNMRHEVPAKIMAAAGDNATTPVRPLVPRPPGDPAAGRTTLASVGDEEIGLDATLKRLRESEVQAHRIYIEALETGQDARAKLAQRSFSDLAKEVIRVEGLARKSLEASRALIPRVEAEMVLGDLHQGVLGGLRAMGAHVFREFGLPATPASDVKWQALVDDFCNQLQTQVFRE